MRFLILASLICLAILPPTYLCAQSNNQKEKVKEAYAFRDKYVYSVKPVQKRFTDTLSFSFINNAIIIPVTIKGQTFNFLFDCGAVTVISDSLKDFLQLKEVGHSINITGSMSRSGDFNLYHLTELKIGQVIFQNLNVGAANLSGFKKALCSKKISGVLGANVMREACWKIDYSKSLIYLSDKRFRLKQKPAYEFDFEENFSGTPMIDMHYGRFNFKAEWDSGNNGYLDFPDSLFFKANDSIPFTVKGMGATIATLTGIPDLSFFMTSVPKLYLDGNVFFNQPVSVIPGETALIGNQFVKMFHQVVIDWSRHKILLLDKPGNADSDLTQTFGLTPNYNHGVCRVAFLWDNAPAAKQGIHLGDTIVFINGQSTVNISDESWCTLRNEVKDGAELKLTIKQNGEVKKYHFQKYDLLAKSGAK